MILVVDDHAVIRDVVRMTIARALEEAGNSDFGAIEEADCAEAAERALTPETRLLLCDLCLPAAPSSGATLEGGVGLMRRIREGQTRAPRDLPIVAMTAYTSQEAMAATNGLDVLDYVPKPVRLRDVVEILQRIG